MALLAAIHRIDGCGQIAFYLKRAFSEGEILCGENVVFPDGRQAQDDDGTGTIGDLVVCGFCRGEVAVADILAAKELS